MKFMIVSLVAMMSVASAFASRDSVAFFYSPKKVSVLINERSLVGRLDGFMRHLGQSNSLRAISQDGSMDLGCARGDIGISCTFTFIPGQDIRIQNRSLAVLTHISALNLANNGAFQMSFASSMKDLFYFEMNENGEILMEGSKKIGQ